MSDAQSKPLLGFLALQATLPEFCIRRRRPLGTLALWDNRCTRHHGVDDYAGQRRVMHRVTICGDTPV